jgi:hypothetical protein
MTLTTASLTLEINRNHLFASLKGREVFVKFGSGFSFWDFEKRREGADVELWGLGMYAVLSKA